MKNFDIYCMCLWDHHLSNLKKLNYTPVGLGENAFSDNWLRDNSGDNISNKNKYYGEYSFYYWYWKNLLKKKSINLISKHFYSVEEIVKIIETKLKKKANYDSVFFKKISFKKYKPYYIKDTYNKSLYLKNIIKRYY